MTTSPDQYRREAELVERMAQAISLLSDRQELLAQVRSLRRSADELEARSAETGRAAPSIGPCD